jgi:hypothetical protein
MTTTNSAAVTLYWLSVQLMEFKLSNTAWLSTFVQTMNFKPVWRITETGNDIQRTHQLHKYAHKTVVSPVKLMNINRHEVSKYRSFITSMLLDVAYRKRVSTAIMQNRRPNRASGMYIGKAADWNTPMGHKQGRDSGLEEPSPIEPTSRDNSDTLKRSRMEDDSVMFASWMYSVHNFKKANYTVTTKEV